MRSHYLLLLACALAPSVIAQGIAAAKLQSECGTLYKVVSGDGCWSIAGAAHITQAQLAALNPGMDCATVQVGQGLCLGLPCSKTYEVVSGEWCAKIQDEQKITESALISLNPGFTCAELFAGQRLCMAVATSTNPTNPQPSPVPTPTGPPVSEPPCSASVPIAQGDTCYNLATAFGIQLATFNKLNPNLDCSTLGAGNIACTFPACGEAYRVQSGDWCAKIEGDHGLASGKLIELNPGLNCDTLAPDTVVCVAAPLAADPAPTGSNYRVWDEFPALSPGKSIQNSPLLSFADSDEPYETFMGKSIFQQDTQHASIFQNADTNKDGKLDSTELEAMMLSHPIMTRGLAGRDEKLSRANAVRQMITSADSNKDGFVSKSEYMDAVYQAQNATTTMNELAIKRRSSELSTHEKRFIQFLIFGGILLLLGAAMVLNVMGHMQEEAKEQAGELLNYLDVVFWDRKGDPPKCSAYIYYSKSCGTWWTKAASRCSNGGKKVFKESCEGPLTEGAKACGFASLGCSSMCWNINTDNCDCDALKYSAETSRTYQDPAITTSTVTGASQCRTKCSDTSGCIGYSVTLIEKSETGEATCKTYKTMTSPSDDKNSTSFRRSTETDGTCPAIPDGYYPLSAEQISKAGKAGDDAADQYADSYAVSRRTIEGRELPHNFDPRDEFSDEEYKSLENRFLQARDLPSGTDLRTKYATTRKNQQKTGMCVSFSMTSTVEGTIKKKFNRSTVTNDLSPTWIAICRAQLDPNKGTKASYVLEKLGHSYLATESCIPFATLDAPTCDKNQCGASSYGKLPYITNSVQMVAATGSRSSKIAWDKIKEHLVDVGPVTNAFSLSKAFAEYSATLAGKNVDEVFYHNMPGYKSHECTYGGHQMTIVGYGHYKQEGKGKDRLYWIVQNSWGITKGKNGYVFLAAGSLGQADQDGWGITVNEGTSRYTELPTTGHDEL